MRARLISLDYLVPRGDTSLEAFPMVIGRAKDNDISVDDYSVADYHCRIECVDDELVVSDLGTVHGTFVNNVRVVEAVLHDGDELAVGMMTFLFLADISQMRDEPSEELVACVAV
jgi:pSer/pThr/pTyr-binding forkhead associated (FHA) protein